MQGTRNPVEITRKPMRFRGRKICPSVFTQKSPQRSLGSIQDAGFSQQLRHIAWSSDSDTSSECAPARRKSRKKRRRRTSSLVTSPCRTLYSQCSRNNKRVILLLVQFCAAYKNVNRKCLMESRFTSFQKMLQKSTEHRCPSIRTRNTNKASSL